ncbi:MAG: hypothetical protein MJ252_07900 [archaeon]|nr:hypothetical protein [archaeon]
MEKKDSKVFLLTIENYIKELYIEDQKFIFPSVSFDLKPGIYEKNITETLFDFSTLEVPKEFTCYYYSKTQINTKVLNQRTSMVTKAAKFLDSREKINKAKIRKCSATGKASKEEIEEEMRENLKYFLIKIFSSEMIDENEIKVVKDTLIEEYGMNFFIKNIYEAVVLLNENEEKYLNEESFKTLTDTLIYLLNFLSNSPKCNEVSFLNRMIKIYKVSMKTSDRKHKVLIFQEIIKGKSKIPVLDKSIFWEQWANAEFDKEGVKKVKNEEEKSKIISQILLGLIPTLKQFKLEKNVMINILEEISQKNIKIEALLSSFKVNLQNALK